MPTICNVIVIFPIYGQFYNPPHPPPLLTATQTPKKPSQIRIK